MAQVTRRQFKALAAGAGVAGVLGWPSRFALAEGPAKIIVVGGGPGGATVANRLKAGNSEFDVTLVEPKEKYTTCFYSNLYLGGFRSFQSITHDYEGIKKRGITVINDSATAVDTMAKTVTLSKGSTPLNYDRLVLAPGIDIKFETIEGYSPETAEIMPHAWQGGAQIWLLKEKLLALPAGGLVVIAAPPNPYRCPPGPYERACMIAHFLKTRKPKSKLIILDAKMTISKQPVFEEAFKEFYGDIIEFNLSNEIDDFSVVRVDAKSGDVVTKGGRTEHAALANVIPAQKAGAIAFKAGVAEGDWCPVNPDNFASLKVKDVYVVGDAAIAADMPKSAFSAVSQASVVAADILADLGSKERAPGKYRNTCWSMVAPDNSAKIGADYLPGKKDGKGFLEAKGPFVSKAGEGPELRRETFNESAGWYSSVVTDIFGTAPSAADTPDTPGSVAPASATEKK